MRWVGSNQIISASTDNHLKLWDVAEAASSEGKCAPITSFTGEGCLFILWVTCPPAVLVLTSVWLLQLAHVVLMHDIAVE